MTHLDAHGKPIVAPAQAPAPAQAATGQPLIDVNQLRTAFSNPKADIPLFYRDSTLDNLSAKFLLDRIKIAYTTHG